MQFNDKSEVTYFWVQNLFWIKGVGKVGEVDLKTGWCNCVWDVAQWLGRRSLAGGFSLIYA